MGEGFWGLSGSAVAILIEEALQYKVCRIWGKSCSTEQRKAADSRWNSPVFGYPVITHPCVWQASWLISFATSACSTESGIGAPVFRLDLMVRDTASPMSTAFWRTSWK